CAHLRDHPGELEARRDREAHELARRAVEPHANDAIGVIDADRARRDVHRAGTGDGVGLRLEAEFVEAARAMDDDSAHAGPLIVASGAVAIGVRSCGSLGPISLPRPLAFGRGSGKAEDSLWKR